VNDFSQLGLSAPILNALVKAGYTQPTPIQTKAIPMIAAGNDILGIAQTGTGKTAAFALPVLDKLIAERKSPPPNGCRVLVLSPTRELAAQIAVNFRTYAGGNRLVIATVFGGVGYRPQIQALTKGVDVLVATPGRLIDHLGSGMVSLRDTGVLILDEADQMLDLGFLKPIRSIVSRMPRERQTLLFSATMPQSISQLAKDFLRDPVRISVSPVSSMAERISQRVIHVEHSQKRALLANLIADHAMHRTLVFTRTKRGADRVAKHLSAVGVRVAAIHGNKSQNQRERALEGFRKSKIDVLVATDIAARGIDVDDVTHVINFELPEVPEAYVHRIGRTARAGASGSAIALCDPSEIAYLRGIERMIRQSIPAEQQVRDDKGAQRLAAITEHPSAEHAPSRARSGKPAPAGGVAKKSSRKRNSRGRQTQSTVSATEAAKPRRRPRRTGKANRHMRAESSAMAQ